MTFFSRLRRPRALFRAFSAVSPIAAPMSPQPRTILLGVSGSMPTSSTYQPDMARYFPGISGSRRNFAYRSDMGKRDGWAESVSRAVVRAAGRLGLTEKDYANRLGLTQSGLSGVKSGSRPIGLDKVVDIAKAAGYGQKETLSMVCLWLRQKLQRSRTGQRHLLFLMEIERLGGNAAAVPYWHELIRDEAVALNLAPEDCGLHPLKGTKADA